MLAGSQGPLIVLVFALLAICGQARVTVDENGVKSMVYLSPKITLHPGSVSNKYYDDIDFPKGHIGIKSFDAEVVDEAGNSVPLTETYLHHWLAVRYYQRKGVKDVKYNDVPDPYGIEFGNPLEVPAGYEEKWVLNIHAIDTRGTVDPMGCTECRCHLYNVTEDEYGRPLKPDYVGGLNCCYDGTQCRVKNGVESIKRNVYFKYTVKWVDWSDYVVPVKVFIFDVTDTWQNTGIHDCLVEYNVEQSTTNDLTSTKRSNVGFPSYGDVVYGVTHLHIGGIASALYGEDGRVICSSEAIYGQGNEAGDEANYIVGMSTCYPEPGSVKIYKGEVLSLESNYSSEKSHTGVMSLFYILIAEPSLKLNDPIQIQQESVIPIFFWGIALFGLAISAAMIVSYRRNKQTEDGYQSIAT